ncbi:hypothetical protein EJ02DRAFT_488217 [Clathrospora elynae]|uniref:Uncharacterized protein n=1 Tax=Clathrospora elynae TaxID=706981 RepID=A0A6A5SRG0_9PLEO|nr:hypothetical protein EJ02DRAFT_488217 [Clathrospora elynae]
MAPEPQSACSTRGKAATNKCAYLNFREYMWDTLIEKVEVKEDELLVYDSPPSACKLFYEFPSHLVSEYDPVVKAGVFCTLTCQEEPFAFMHLLITQLLQCLTVKVGEVEVDMIKSSRKVTIIFQNGEKYSNWPKRSHMPLLLTFIRTGKAWYMDFTGTQYGLKHTLWIATDFDKRYVSKIKHVDLAGKNKACIEIFSLKTNRLGLILCKSLEATDRMNAAITT